MNLYQDNAPDADEATQGITFEEYQEMKQACEELVVKAKAASKLVEDPNFCLIIMEEYFTKEPQRLGSLMASGRLNKANFDGAVEDLRSIGHLTQFLRMYIEKGNIAADELKQLEEAYQASLDAQAAS